MATPQPGHAHPDHAHQARWDSPGTSGFFGSSWAPSAPSPPAEGQGLCQRPLNGTHCGCPKGFEGTPWESSQPWEQRCEDINECLREGPPPCPPSQSCHNTEGGFRCECNRGYRAGTPPRQRDTPENGTGTPENGTGTPKKQHGTPENGTLKTAPGPPKTAPGPPKMGSGPPKMAPGPPKTAPGPPKMGLGPPKMGLGPPKMAPFIVKMWTNAPRWGRGCAGGAPFASTPPGASSATAPPPGRGPPGPDGCPAVPVPPEICPEEEEGCDLGESLARIAEELRGGRDPRSLLQELLSVLGGALGGSLAAAPPPQRLPRLSALLEAGEGLARGAGTRLPQGGVTNVTMETAALSLAVSRGAPPGPVTLGVPGVTLEVPPEVALDEESGLSLVGLLTLAGLPGALSGAPPVLWGVGRGPCPAPPRRGRPFPAFRVLSPVGAAFVARASPRPPRDGPAATLRFRHPAPDPKLGGTIVCAFWNPRAGRWDTGGCRVVPPKNGTPPPRGAPRHRLRLRPPDELRCPDGLQRDPDIADDVTDDVTDGVTDITDGVTDDVIGVTIPSQDHWLLDLDHWLLDLVTRVALSVSVVALVAAAATFALCRAVAEPRRTLQLHLSLSLLGGHLAFLLGIDGAHSPVSCVVTAVVLHLSYLSAFCVLCGDSGGPAPVLPVSCVVTAVVLHLSYLSAFCWMALQGAHLYVLLVQVFAPAWLRPRPLLALGYGPALAIVGLSAAAFPKGYGTDQ
uniref:adhesion G protein-coupled receptor E2-like n=1 Tax=Agelaius phoeniceus TaxID=39638 RepID=UPI0023EDB84D|nr:adhesion G protein-coupled receptor E2-like [Agelaius phoeniceus]